MQEVDVLLLYFRLLGMKMLVAGFERFLGGKLALGV
jgi:hypothetical protein